MQLFGCVEIICNGQYWMRYKVMHVTCTVCTWRARDCIILIHLQVQTKTNSGCLYEAVLHSISARSDFLPDQFKAYLRELFSDKSGSAETHLREMCEQFMQQEEHAGPLEDTVLQVVSDTLGIIIVIVTSRPTPQTIIPRQVKCHVPVFITYSTTSSGKASSFSKISNCSS